MRSERAQRGRGSRLGGLAAAVVLAAFAAGTAGAAAIDRWSDDLAVLVRLGDRFVSTYDLILHIAYQRMQQAQPLDDPPDERAWREALSGVFNQVVLLDAAERFEATFPDVAEIERESQELLDRYGEGDEQRFWIATGIPHTRIIEEIRRQLIVGRYVRTALVANIRVTPAEVRDYYARTATAWAGVPFERMQPQIERLLVVQRLRDELERLRERFLDRVELEIFDPRFREADLRRVWAPGETTPLRAIPSDEAP